MVLVVMGLSMSIILMNILIGVLAESYNRGPGEPGRTMGELHVGVNEEVRRIDSVLGGTF